PQARSPPRAHRSRRPLILCETVVDRLELLVVVVIDDEAAAPRAPAQANARPQRLTEPFLDLGRVAGPRARPPLGAGRLLRGGATPAGRSRLASGPTPRRAAGRPPPVPAGGGRRAARSQPAPARAAPWASPRAPPPPRAPARRASPPASAARRRSVGSAGLH